MVTSRYCLQRQEASTFAESRALVSDTTIPTTKERWVGGLAQAPTDQAIWLERRSAFHRADVPTVLMLLYACVIVDEVVSIFVCDVEMIDDLR